MPGSRAANNPDILPDRDEPTSLMEPLLLSDARKSRGGLYDLALELTAKSAGFARSLPHGVLSSLADLVRALNCYYSNLIEGHDTHPVDIERALKNDYSQDRKKRDLQIEARAHIDVQRWIDRGGLTGRSSLRTEGLREVHRRFCEALPEDLLWVEEPSTGRRVRLVPGELRRCDVKVGDHIAVSPGALPRFLNRFEEVYAPLGKTELIIATAAAHHRLLWMHPFLDGNGRVARLVSHAVFNELIDTGTVWSVARGLARNVQRYKVLLANCDLARRNDLDGRGTLSEEALAEFTSFFLKVCIDQVDFMDHLVQPDRLRARILQWSETETRLGALPAKAGTLLEAVLYRGELPRGEADSVLGVGARQSRRIVSVLLDREVLVSDGPRAPLRLAFPAALASAWMPGLFPESSQA
jgi:Fic family protein